MQKSAEDKIILLVDQNEHDVDLLKRAAEQSCEACVHRVRSGQEAIDYLAHAGNSSSRFPKLIIVEWDLPSADAFSVLRFVNGTRELKAIPVIILTGIYSQEHIESARALGAESVFLKPTDLDEMEKLVYALCEVYIHFELPPAPVRDERATI
jgi:CheY-like chemotaxis protein